MAVSEELHFGRAARRLHMSQPPLSAAIKKLEDELGVRLFDRTSRAVVLTAAGQVFTHETRKILASLEVAVAAARRAGGGELALRIGFAPYLPTELLIRFLDGLQKRQPQLRAQVKHVLGFEQVRLLQRGELDLGIFAISKAEPRLQTEPLYPGEPLSAFLARDHSLAEKAVLTPDDLANQTLVTLVGDEQPTDPAAVWLPGLQQFGYRFRALRGASELRDCFLAVAAGAGIALLPGSVLTDADAGTTIVRRPLDPPLTWPDTVVAWRTHPSGQAKALINEVRGLAHALAERRDRGCSRRRGTQVSRGEQEHG